MDERCCCGNVDVLFGLPYPVTPVLEPAVRLFDAGVRGHREQAALQFAFEAVDDRQYEDQGGNGHGDAEHRYRRDQRNKVVTAA